MRYALKMAIWKTGKTQRQISLEAHIPEGRLSELVRGRGAEPTELERDTLAELLERHVDELFPLAEPPVRPRPGRADQRQRASS